MRTLTSLFKKKPAEQPKPPAKAMDEFTARSRALNLAPDPGRRTHTVPPGTQRVESLCVGGGGGSGGGGGGSGGGAGVVRYNTIYLTTG